MNSTYAAHATCSDCGAEAGFWTDLHSDDPVDLDETPCPITGCDGTLLWSEGEAR